MELIDTILTPLIPTLVIIHLLIAPYTKVEESFNIQATHDILTYSLNVPRFDHIEFPGAVPRTFVGALTLAGVSKPIILLAGTQYSQFIARALLGLFNAWALGQYKAALVKTYGKDVGRWYVLLQASQFHVLYYASRTLPNMFAFGLTTLAMGQLLPSSRPQDKPFIVRKQKLGIFLLVFSGVVFRSEIAVLLFTQLAYMLVHPRISLETIVPTGLRSSSISLITSFVFDSYFWGKPIWPEFAGFYFNAIQGKSEEWGTSPMLYYFTNLLPKLLLNPLILSLLIPLAMTIPALKPRAKELIIPSLLFIAIYSLQPHKEARFIIYAVPPLTAAASLSASYIWTRRSKTLLYQLGSLAIIASVIGSFVASTSMLLISSLNYPGGEAISLINTIIQNDSSNLNKNTTTIKIHIDVLSCMTGVTRFQQLPLSHPSPYQNTQVLYDKTENATLLHQPAFWTRFDYALMEHPELAIGKWEVVDTVFGYAGIEILRPGSVALDMAVQSSSKEAESVQMEGLFGQTGRVDIVRAVRENARKITGGWWVGPRMEPKIRVLKRIKEELVV